MKRLNSFAKLGILMMASRVLFAYLDPGSGSLIIQLLVAILAGLLATFRFWKSRLLALFGIKPDPEDDAENDDSD